MIEPSHNSNQGGVALEKAYLRGAEIKATSRGCCQKREDAQDH